MLEHHRDLRADLRRDLCPLAALPEREGLRRLGFERRREERHGGDVCVEHHLRGCRCRGSASYYKWGSKQSKAHLVLLAGEVPDAQARRDALLAVAPRSCLEDGEPVVHERLRVRARRAEIHELDLFLGRVSEVNTARLSFFFV